MQGGAARFQTVGESRCLGFEVDDVGHKSAVQVELTKCGLACSLDRVSESITQLSGSYWEQSSMSVREAISLGAAAVKFEYFGRNVTAEMARSSIPCAVEPPHQEFLSPAELFDQTVVWPIAVGFLERSVSVLCSYEAEPSRCPIAFLPPSEVEC